MLYRLLWIVFVIVLAACGKNQAVAPFAPVPPSAGAPYPGQPMYPNGGGVYPNGGAYPGGYYTPYGAPYTYPGSSNYVPSPYYNPGLPGGYPSAYTPFMPLDYFMRSNPTHAPYWQQHWNGWQQWAGYNGISPYDFNTFWFHYCPQVWQGTEYWDLYRYFDTNFYYWWNPGNVYGPWDPGATWVNYSGYSYYGLYQLGY
jgi:hypothetical protein